MDLRPSVYINIQAGCGKSTRSVPDMLSFFSFLIRKIAGKKVRCSDCKVCQRCCHPQEALHCRFPLYALYQCPPKWSHHFSKVSTSLPQTFLELASSLIYAFLMFQRRPSFLAYRCSALSSMSPSPHHFTVKFNYLIEVHYVFMFL